MNKIILALKGMCMGFADVVPGVSGGTMALILGIYRDFIEAIKSVNFRWIAPLFVWIASGFSAEKRDGFLDPVKAIHWNFLVPLGVGIVLAFGVGAKVIPELMDRYPEQMFGFFMGLILASTIVPFRMMKKRGVGEAAAVIVAAAATFAIIGAETEPALSWNVQTLDETVNLEDFTRAHPSIRTPEELYCGFGDGEDNQPLRDAIANDPDQPGVGAQLDEICTNLDARTDDLESYLNYRDSVTNDDGESILGRKHDENPFNSVLVPTNTPVQVPTPALWYIFICGMIGICAMVLPGISGSFILLVLGVYHFMLSSAIKGFVYTLIDRQIPESQALYVGVFGFGCLIGILSFAQALSFLLKKYESMTLGALTGLMIGSLRAIWPFKLGDAHVGVVNYVPSDVGPWVSVGAAIVLGFAVVAVLSFVGARAESSTQSQSAA